jgi:Mrp family chromosome partitioning ATPase
VGFDLVIVDTPPVLVAGNASIVSTMVSGAIVVVRAGATERAAAAVKQIRMVGARLLGAVAGKHPTEHLCCRSRL